MAALSRLLAATAICLSSVFAPTFAHPGKHYDQAEVLEEARARGLEALEQKAQYDGCANPEESIARDECTILRRAATVQRLREERSLLDGESSSVYEMRDR
jgi:hypothetical protein